LSAAFWDRQNPNLPFVIAQINETNREQFAIIQADILWCFDLMQETIPPVARKILTDVFPRESGRRYSKGVRQANAAF
jgi:hypothetical protein